MRIDLYTKAILTIIAVLLAVIAGSHLVRPQSVAAAASDLQFMGGSDMIVMDKTTGGVWKYHMYNAAGDTNVIYCGKFVKAGADLVR